MTVYEAVGGEPYFVALVDRFYQAVESDPLLSVLYPADDMVGARRRLRLFLMQYFGGPGTYSQERGHPRLRMRHMGFAVGATEAEAWLTHMRAAVHSTPGAPEAAAEMMLAYFEGTATFLRNR